MKAAEPYSAKEVSDRYLNILDNNHEKYNLEEVATNASYITYD